MRRSRAGDDILREILALDGDDRLSDDEAPGVCLMLALAGLEAVTDALSLGTERPATHPERYQELVDAPSLPRPGRRGETAPADPPAPFLPRMTTEDVEIGGCPCRPAPSGPCPIPARPWVRPTFVRGAGRRR